MSRINAVAVTVPPLAIFTDFDGTLVEIAEADDAVEVAATLTDQLQRAMNEFDSAFAVLTGREIPDIDRFLAPLHLPLALRKTLAERDGRCQSLMRAAYKHSVDNWSESFLEHVASGA